MYINLLLKYYKYELTISGGIKIISYFNHELNVFKKYNWFQLYIVRLNFIKISLEKRGYY